MSQSVQTPALRGLYPARQRGAALVVGLLLLLVLTLLAISGMSTAALELLMSGNQQYQERAFQFADAGIEQAMARGVFNTGATVGNYNNPTGPNPTPIRGQGAQIQNCPEPDGEQCEYFMRHDFAAGATDVPPRRDGTFWSAGAGVKAYHFVVDSYGVSNRGALSEHTQSFYVLGPDAGQELP